MYSRQTIGCPEPDVGQSPLPAGSMQVLVS